MADPIVTYLPQLSAALGAGPVTAPAVAGTGTPLQRALVTNAAPLPAPTAAQLQAQFGNTPYVAPSAPPATPVAPPAPAVKPATPKLPAAAKPATANGPVSPTPGAGNPLPPNMRDTATDVPLPMGGLPGGAGATAPALAGIVPAAPTSAYATAPAVPVGAGPSPVSTGSIQSPQAIINAGFDTQTQRAENYIGQAMNYVNAGGNIFERATRGRFINGLLSATVGPNNVGQVQGQGQDTLNSALAGVEAAGTAANATKYAADIGLQRTQATNAAAQQLEAQQRQNTPVVIGQRTYKNALGLLTQEPIYGLPTLGTGGQATQFNPIAPNGMVVRPSSPQAPAQPQEGATRTHASGAVDRYDAAKKTWVPEKTQ